MTPLLWWLFAGGAFIAGSIPFGVLISRAKGLDIRTFGSGNIGATNVGRALGRRYFFLCFTLDCLKGLLPTLGCGIAAGFVGGGLDASAELSAAALWAWLGVMVCPVLGHMFSPWVGFKGGKGVATGLGALLGVFPLLTIAGVGSFVVWFASVKLTRYVGVSSALAAASLPAWVWLILTASDRNLIETIGWSVGWPAVVVTGVLGALVVVKHLGNISRTLSGVEPKTGE